MDVLHGDNPVVSEPQAQPQSEYTRVKAELSEFGRSTVVREGNDHGLHVGSLLEIHPDAGDHGAPFRVLVIEAQTDPSGNQSSFTVTYRKTFPRIGSPDGL